MRNTIKTKPKASAKTKAKRIKPQRSLRMRTGVKAGDEAAGSEN